MLFDPNRVFAGFAATPGGMDSGNASHLILDTQVSKAINLTFRGGTVRTRPGFERVTLEFANHDAELSFTKKHFQGAGTYHAPQGMQMLAVVEGRVFRLLFQQSDYAVVADITPDGLDLDRTQRHAYFQQAGRYFVIQDGVNKPLIYDGWTLRRAGNDEVPTGSVMAYGLGRLWVGVGQDFYAGDLEGTASDAAIKFTENIYLTEGGGFTFPSELGELRAFIFPPVQDSSTGQGELLVLGDYGALSLAASVSRSVWKSTPGFVRVTLRNFGATGSRALSTVNGDVIYRAIDGVRSYRMARSEQGGWGQTPQSREVSSFLETDAPELLVSCRTAVYDNRLFVTYGPEIAEQNNVRHLGMVVLDFDVVGSMASKQPPVWDGAWTGVMPVEMIPARVDRVEQLYIFSHDSDDTVRCYKVSKSAPFDPEKTRIQSVLETKAYDFGSPFAEKELYGADLWLSGMWGDVTIDVKHRPDTFACWSGWETVEACAPFETAAAAVNGFLPTPVMQHRPRVQLHTPPETFDPVTHWLLRRGMTHQLRIEITGQVTLSKLRVHALTQVEETLNG